MLIKKLFIIVAISLSLVLIKLFSNKIIFSEFATPFPKWHLTLFKNFLFFVTSLISKFLWYCFLLYIRELHSNFVELYICTNFIHFLLLLNKFPWCFHDLFFKFHCYKGFIVMCRCFLSDWCMFIWKNCKSLIECTVCIIFQVFEIFI